MKNILTVLAMSVAGALTFPATAADPAKPPATPGSTTSPSAPPGTGAPQGVPAEAGRTELPPMFRELDQDKDGQVSKEEAKRSAEAQATFDAIDTDHSGKISLLEWNAAEQTKKRGKP